MVAIRQNFVVFHCFFGQPIKIFWEDCRLPHRVNNAATTKSVTTACLHWLSQPQKTDRAFIFAFQRWIKEFFISFRPWFNSVWRWIQLSRGICSARGWHGVGMRNEPKNSWAIGATLHVWWSFQFCHWSFACYCVRALPKKCGHWSPVTYGRFTDR